MNSAFEQSRVYLLRLRRLDNNDQPLWYFTLESVDGSTRHEFRGLPALTDFLSLCTVALDVQAQRATTEDEQRRKPT